MAKKNRKKPPLAGKPGRDNRAVVSETPPPATPRSVMGRPTTYDPKYCDMLVAHMTQGYSFESFGADVEGIACVATLYNWAKEHPEFLEAKKKGQQACRKFWETQGLVGMHTKGFNATVWIFNMKNRFKWTDRTEHTGPDGGPVVIRADEPLTEEEAARLAEIKAKLHELEAG